MSSSLSLGVGLVGHLVALAPSVSSLPQDVTPTPATAAVPTIVPSASASATPSTFGSGVINFAFLLSVIVWLPVMFALVIAVFPRGVRGRFERWPLGFAFWAMAFTLLFTLIGYSQFQQFTSGIQFEEKLPWLPAIGVSYHLGVDGIGITVLLLNQLVGLAAVLASWEVRDRARQYFAFLLLAEAAVSGTVATRDFFMLFLFWSAAAVPLALLVAGWGGPRRQAGAARLLAYWGLGAAALLAGGLLIYQAAGGSDFDLATLSQAQPASRLQFVAGALIVIAAATRLPLFPFLGWVRDVYAEAPAGVVIVVAGAATRLGGYVMIRLLVAAMPAGSRALAPYIGILAGATVIYAALAALRSTDLRHSAGYLAVVPGAVTALGLSGLTPLSLHGTILSLFAGGLAAAMLVGTAATFAERAQARSLATAAGLAGRMPVLSWLLLVAALAVLGVPFAATFASGVMVFGGSFIKAPAPAFSVAIGVVLAGVATARLAARLLFGAPNPEAPAPADASLSEKWYLGILIGALLWVGLVPGGPKLAGIPLFDPGMINVVNSAASDLGSQYAPSPPPTPSPTPSPSPSPSPSP
jgi:NADH-quinone oxidoreductase subunit M